MEQRTRVVLPAHLFREQARAMANALAATIRARLTAHPDQRDEVLENARARDAESLHQLASASNQSFDDESKRLRLVASAKTLLLAEAQAEIKSLHAALRENSRPGDKTP